jgi:hypothetical protein
MIGCRFCRAPVIVGELACRDSIACNFRCRVNLGMSAQLCGLWKRRDLEQQRLCRRYRRAAA